MSGVNLPVEEICGGIVWGKCLECFQREFWGEMSASHAGLQVPACSGYDLCTIHYPYSLAMFHCHVKHSSIHTPSSWYDEKENVPSSTNVEWTQLEKHTNVYKIPMTYLSLCLSVSVSVSFSWDDMMTHEHAPTASMLLITRLNIWQYIKIMKRNKQLECSYWKYEPSF